MSEPRTSSIAAQKQVIENLSARYPQAEPGAATPEWFDQLLTTLASNGDQTEAIDWQQPLSIAYGMAKRRAGERALDLRQLLLAALCQLRSDAEASAWIHDCWLCGSTDEQVAICRAFATFAQPQAYLDLAAKAIRSNASVVVAAFAHQNSFPLEHADEAMWNRMILKCLFTGLALWPISGFDQRCNPTLARQCADYARERRAANRPVPPECWRAIVAYEQSDRHLQDLIAALDPDRDQRDLAAVELGRAAANTERDQRWHELQQAFLAIV